MFIEIQYLLFFILYLIPPAVVLLTCTPQERETLSELNLKGRFFATLSLLFWPLFLIGDLLIGGLLPVACLKTDDLSLKKEG